MRRFIPPPTPLNLLSRIKPHPNLIRVHWQFRQKQLNHIYNTRLTLAAAFRSIQIYTYIILLHSLQFLKFLTMTYITIYHFRQLFVLAQHDQPIDWIEPNSTSRLAQVEAKVVCWVRKTSRSTRTLNHQDPFLVRHGSLPTANRPPHLVASYDMQGGTEDVYVPTGSLIRRKTIT